MPVDQEPGWNKTRRDLMVGFPSSFRVFLDDLARDVNLSNERGVAKDAEIVRVLLVSGLAELSGDHHLSVADRAVAGLYVNSTMESFGEAASVIGRLRRDLASFAMRTVGSSLSVRVPPTKAVPGRKDREAINRNRVHLKIDDYLRRRINEIVWADSLLPEGRSVGYIHDKAPDLAVIRAALSLVAENQDQHKVVVHEYARWSRRMHETVIAALDAAWRTAQNSFRAA